ncbi:MAG TPA: MoaD/ThiS family protein [Polyangiaceae bacterium]|nr:MoaD/ThiS family protein [Polyangiaceae bacterium]
MRIQIRVFAVLRELLPASQFELEVPAGASCDAVCARLTREFAAAKSILEHCMLAVNGQYAARELRLSEGDELALLPPVSGG